jgi:hypothetical protein
MVKVFGITASWVLLLSCMATAQEFGPWHIARSTTQLVHLAQQNQAVDRQQVAALQKRANHQGKPRQHGFLPHHDEHRDAAADNARTHRTAEAYVPQETRLLRDACHYWTERRPNSAEGPIDLFAVA